MHRSFKVFILWIWATFFIPFIVWPQHSLAQEFDESTPSTLEMEQIFRSEISPELRPLDLREILKNLIKNGAPAALAEANVGRALDLSGFLTTLQESYDREERIVAANDKQGFVRTDVRGQVQLRPYANSDALDADAILSQINEIRSVPLEGVEPSGMLSEFTREDIQTILSLVKELKAEAIQKIENPPLHKFPTLKNESMKERLNYLMDKNWIQIPAYDAKISKENRAQMPRAELTKVNGSLIIRVILPHHPESILIEDSAFLSRFSQKYTFYVARQLTRAGNGTGRPVLAIRQTLDEKNPLHLEFIPKPSTLYDKIKNSTRAAFPGVTKNDWFFATLYTATVVGLGSFSLYIKQYGFKGLTPDGAGIHNVSEAVVFFKSQLPALASHIICSFTIGLFHPTYRYIFYHGEKWWQSVKHFSFISFPAAFATYVALFGLKSVDPTTLAGIGGLLHISWNSIFTNYTRAILYSVPIARTNHRINTREIQIPFLNVSVKRQTLEAELIGFMVLFIAKFGQLIHVQAGDVPVGDMFFYGLPFVAYTGSYFYLKGKTASQAVDYSQEIKELNKGLLTPVRGSVWAVKKLRDIAVAGCKGTLAALKGPREASYHPPF
ncbi:MAG: hypothetical protein J0L93_04455 [Deltaproteobacteria bacterium]|nr:hypothetical protein [Deltaproteobacteria bacterium]